MCACTCIVVRLCVAFFFAVFAVSFDVANEGSGKIEKSDDHSFSVRGVARSVVGNVFLCCQDCSKTVQGNLGYIYTIVGLVFSYGFYFRKLTCVRKLNPNESFCTIL